MLAGKMSMYFIFDFSNRNLLYLNSIHSFILFLFSSWIVCGSFSDFFEYFATSTDFDKMPIFRLFLLYTHVSTK